MQIMLSDTVRLIQYNNICQLIFNIKKLSFPSLSFNRLAYLRKHVVPLEVYA
jgi:hypothetical protein